MSIKSDKWIRRMAEQARMIEPFAPDLVRTNDTGRIVSYGTSSYGYDVRVANEFKIFTNINSTIVDPKDFDARNFVDFTGDVCIIPPNSFALARTVEYFRIPRSVLTVCLGKSTYARCGIIVNVTPLEPEWEGHVTLELSNTTPLPAKIYANEGGKIVSYGTSSYGYDVRVANEFKIFTNINSTIVDPKNFDERNAARAREPGRCRARPPQRTGAARAIRPT